MSTPISPTLKAHEQNNNKFNPKRLTLVFVSVMLAIVSCSKKDVCENCNQNNAWPIAKAGIDTIIVSPTDSILLNGSSSSDLDGNISTYNWSEVPSFHAGSVPAIRNNIEKQTVVTNLRPGIYRFSLKVTDNKGAYSFDTVTVQVEDRVYPTHPVGFYPSLYSGLSWNITATGTMVIGPVPDWQFADFPEDNDGHKWKVQLVQQATNTAIFLPYVKYAGVSTSSQSIFYSISDLAVIYQGENPVGSIYIFANPTQTSGIDLSKPVDVIVYVKF